MRHRSQHTNDILEKIQQGNGEILLYDDVYHGRDYLAAVERGDITTDDMVLLLTALNSTKASNLTAGLPSGLF
jgi:hypothetical protein